MSLIRVTLVLGRGTRQRLVYILVQYLIAAILDASLLGI